ncbi:uncharacterized protein BXZ73DRAFT_98214 [Epithele typhae]|uniref:uncharacterized protein n=1 Tax=Epithele typhae TaxID=378194 RepID=UPI002007B26E|nr:uncharacterized protein BXZ73DRAFT_98214 [Epithele typhae]KAH9941826.1 hypothetical protein BXZ73DRAFT_98214 [Epithele typhae]
MASTSRKKPRLAQRTTDGPASGYAPKWTHPNGNTPPSLSINNVLGSRLTLLLGTTRAYNIHHGVGGFVIVAGAYLGISAGFFWTAQGSLLLAYPTEQQKGMFIAIFWFIFNLRGVISAATVSLGENFDNTSNSVANGTSLLLAQPPRTLREVRARATGYPPGGTCTP